MNERQARRAVLLADERLAIVRDLDILTNPERHLGEGLGLVIVTKDWPPIAARIDGVGHHWPVIPTATKLTAQIPREAFNAVLTTMVVASRARIVAIEYELHELGVDP